MEMRQSVTLYSTRSGNSELSSSWDRLVSLSNRPQVPMVYRLINHAGCWLNTRRICKLLCRCRLELIMSFSVVSSVQQEIKLDIYFYSNFSLFDSLIDISREQ